MFIVTQLIGLAVIHAYTPVLDEQNQTINPLPYGMQPPSEVETGISLVSIIIAFILAITFIFFLTKLKAARFIRLWFFLVVTIVLGITLNALLSRFFHHSLMINGIILPIAPTLAIIIALPLAIYKIFKRNIIVHNLTELMIYPGIAVVFIPLLSVWTIILLLLLISVYDMWAVWHTGFMQKMAKYQIDELKLFAGFFVPYLNKKQRAMVKQAKLSKKPLKQKKMKVSLAILGGGDVVFPIITAGVIFRTLGLIPALIVIAGATIALVTLFYYSKKGKFYPAMPFITAGLLAGICVAYLI